MKIPVCMATQHPDSGCYVSVQDEPAEAISSFTKYECDEYMVDYEGKLTPYHQVAQIVSGILHDTDLIPGKDVFVTPRMSSAEHEVVFRQLMAMMATMEANFLAIPKTEVPAIVEAIHPMSRTSEELLKAKQRFYDVMEIARKELGVKMEREQFNIIPLIEQVPQLLNAGGIVGEFIGRHKSEMGFELTDLRVLLGRSDPALSFGHISSALSCKLAISDLVWVSSNTGVRIHPIFGGGSLPFRGFISPDNIKNFMREYSGVKTVTIQSSLRYDYGMEATKKVVGTLKDKLQKGKPLSYTVEEKEEIILFSAIFAKNFIKTLAKLSGLVGGVSDIIPSQRDRLVHRGDFSYARGIHGLEEFARLCSTVPRGKEIASELLKLDEITNLPRAIKFTAAFYTLGFPPEFLGTGRALNEIKNTLGAETLDNLLTKYYPSIKTDLEFASRFLNLETICRFVSPEVMAELKDDIRYSTDLLGFDIESDKMHNTLSEMAVPYLKYFLDGTEKVFQEKDEDEVREALKSLILKMSGRRGALG